MSRRNSGYFVSHPVYTITDALRSRGLIDFFEKGKRAGKRSGKPLSLRASC